MRLFTQSWAGSKAATAPVAVPPKAIGSAAPRVKAPVSQRTSIIGRQAAPRTLRKTMMPVQAVASGAPPASGMEGLAAWISANYTGMGKSAMDAMPELRRAGVTASGSSFALRGQRMDAAEIAQALRLTARPGSRPISPVRSSAPAASYTPPAASYSAPAAAAAPAGSPSGLDGLAAWISANYMGMGKSAADALPELRRKGITASGSGFMMGGRPMDGPGIAQALRLQVRPNSRTASPIRPAASAASFTPAPSASSASAPGLEGLAAWISANYMGMGKSAMDALPELRRKGITAAGNSFSMNGQIMGAPEIAQALRLQARTPSRPSTPVPSRPAPSSGASTASYSVPAASAGSGAGLENLAAWISANYMGMGKSAMDALPELRRKGITASGNNFSMNGRIMGAPDIAQALRLQARTPSRPTTPIGSRSQSPAPSSFSAPVAAASAPSTGSAPGLEGLAAWISANYMGMGKSAMDALPELRRKGITASGNNFSMNGQIMSADEVASALRLQARTPSRPTTPIGSRSQSPAPSYSAPRAAAPAAPAASAGSGAGLEGLAAWISANYTGMGKSAMDAMPELRRAGVTASGKSYALRGQRMDAPEIAQALRLTARPGLRPQSPTRAQVGSSW